MDFIFFKSSWIPASAGMTTKNHVFLMFVSPAKAGVQFEAFKRKGPPTNRASQKSLFQDKKFGTNDLTKRALSGCPERFADRATSSTVI